MPLFEVEHFFLTVGQNNFGNKISLFQVFLEEMQEIQFQQAVHVQMELKFRPHLGQPNLQFFHHFVIPSNIFAFFFHIFTEF